MCILPGLTTLSLDLLDINYKCLFISDLWRVLQQNKARGWCNPNGLYHLYSFVVLCITFHQPESKTQTKDVHAGANRVDCGKVTKTCPCKKKKKKKKISFKN